MMRFVIKWLMKTRVYDFIMANIVPFLRLPWAPNYLTSKKIPHGLSKVRAGDILLSVDESKLTALVPGKFSHAAVCTAKYIMRVGKTNTIWPIAVVAEMTRRGWGTIDFRVFCSESTRVIVLRCEEFDDVYKQQFINRVNSFKNVKYDNQFSLSNIKSLYCSEMVYHADFEKRLQVSLEDLLGIGREYLSPDGLLKAKNTEVIWDSK